MQFAKDSFYIALRDRLAALDPSRIVLIDGVPLVALLVEENGPATCAKMAPGAYYVTWGAARVLDKHQDGSRPVIAIDCSVSYWTGGTAEAGVDRGRVLGQLDTELMAICHPPTTAKRDFTQSPSLDLGTNIFWTSPQLEEVKPAPGLSGSGADALYRRAHLTVFFFPEMELS